MTCPNTKFANQIVFSAFADSTDPATRFYDRIKTKIEENKKEIYPNYSYSRIDNNIEIKDCMAISKNIFEEKNIPVDFETQDTIGGFNNGKHYVFSCSLSKFFVHISSFNDIKISESAKYITTTAYMEKKRKYTNSKPKIKWLKITNNFKKISKCESKGEELVRYLNVKVEHKVSTKNTLALRFSIKDIKYLVICEVGTTIFYATTSNNLKKVLNFKDLVVKYREP